MVMGHLRGDRSKCESDDARARERLAWSRKGRVVSVTAVRETDDIVLITAKGMIIRTRVGEISVIGRNTQGVKVMNLKAGDRLFAGTVVAAESGSDDQP